MNKMDIAIVGGGIGGLCTAVGLQRAGHHAVVYEGAVELRALGAGLVLSVNAMQALRQLGLESAVQSIGCALDRVSLLDQRSRPISETSMASVAATYGVGNFSVHRADLQQVLIDQLVANTLRLGKRCKEVVQEKHCVKLRFEDESEAVADGIIAFDGIHSAVRQQWLPEVSLRYAGYTCWRAVIPYAFEHHPKRFSETWGRQGRFGIVPLTDQRIYWFATMNARQQNSPLRNYTVADLQQNFRRYHAPIPDVLEQTSDEHLLWNDIVDFKPIDHYAFGRVVLAGDAAHAMTPNLGQGAGMAIEDAAVLTDCLVHRSSPEEAFRWFEQRRRKRVSAIVNGSFQLGRVAQLSHPWVSALRNGLLRMVPERMAQRQTRSLYQVDL